MCVIYDRLTKAPFSFGLPTCVLTHRAEGWGSGELDRTEELLTSRQGRLLHSLSKSLRVDRAELCADLKMCTTACV